MKAILVQHAQALLKEEDPDRPLSQEGRDTIQTIADYAASHLDLELGRIWHSGKTRTLQTAEVLNSTLGTSIGVRSSEELSPLDDPRAWAERLAEMAHDVMLVGHLPHLSRLASLLLTGDPDIEPIAFQNAGLVCLERQEGWKLRWMLTPELLR